jgi:ribose transport system ATP-binding protein
MDQDDRTTSRAVPAREILELKGATKAFGSFFALRDVDFALRGGEVHALVGENGAGKSTLIGIMVGGHTLTSGQYFIDGKPVQHLTPHRARLAGVRAVFQEFSLVPDLSVEANLFLGQEELKAGLLDLRTMRRLAREHLRKIGFDIEPRSIVRTLSRGEQQMVEIAKALLGEVRVLILDEPTASLTESEAARLFKLVGTLRSQGVGIVYVSHRMGEVRQIADRITILRDGSLVGTHAMNELTDAAVVESMTGKQISVLFPKFQTKTDGVLLQTYGLSTADGKVRDVSMHVRAGEVVGLAGLVGCGKSEIARAIFGLEAVSAGTVTLTGKPPDTRSNPTRMLAAGVCYFPADRVVEGLALDRPIRENVSMAALDLLDFVRRGLVRTRSEKKQVSAVVDRLKIKPREIERPVKSLSGGNRQKVLLARGMTRDIRLFLFDEPTVGIDVGAKAEVYNIVRELAERGAGIVLVSSDLTEIVGLSHRVYVIRDGRICDELEGDGISEETVLSPIFMHATA